MSSIRVRFVRGEDVKYISHLDLMKAFERALRRAKLPIAYSQGFNPHPQMVFGLPLSVGVTSEAEYADFELTEDIQPDEFMRLLNSQLPSGLNVVEACIRINKNNIMASVTGASYKVLACAEEKLNDQEIGKKTDEFLASQEIITGKETKNGLKMIDIRPMIRNFILESYGLNSIIAAPLCSSNKYIRNYAHILEQTPAYNTQCSNERVMCFDMKLSAGSSANLKPELLFKAFGEFCKTGFHIVKVHRTGLFTGMKESGSNPLTDA